METIGRRLLNGSPFSLEPLLAALAYRLFEQFKQIGTLREAGIRAYNLQPLQRVASSGSERGRGLEQPQITD